MYRLIFALMFVPLFSQEIMFSYFDKVQYNETKVSEFDFTTMEKEDLDSAFMLSYNYAINPTTSPLTLMGGTSVAKWNGYYDEIYAYSTYLSARLSPISILICSPYVEVSIAGPTYLSKQTLGDLDFGSKVLYQHYISAGVKIASALIEARLINYSESLPTAFTSSSTTLPVIISVGLSY
ncbi:MAG: hypothetical protein S4CHLAM20_05490 [Chlamydiia bacterium]|nr:hypothetical protein [Chlamydiia bacterium]